MVCVRRISCEPIVKAVARALARKARVTIITSREEDGSPILQWLVELGANVYCRISPKGHMNNKVPCDQRRSLATTHDTDALAVVCVRQEGPGERLA